MIINMVMLMIIIRKVNPLNFLTKTYRVLRVDRIYPRAKLVRIPTPSQFRVNPQ